MYADFNGLRPYASSEFDSRVSLTGYGSLRSLAAQKLQLVDGMRMIIFEPNDVEADGIASFDSSEVDPAGRRGEWFVLVNENEIRRSNRAEPTDQTHRCFECGADLDEMLKANGRKYTEKCPECSTSIMAPLKPPTNAI